MQGCSGEQGRTGSNLPAQVDFQHRQTHLGSQEAALIARFVWIYPCFTAAPSQAVGRWLWHPSIHPSIHLKALFLLVFSGARRCGLFFRMVVGCISLQVQLKPQETGITHTDVWETERSLNEFTVCIYMGVFYGSFPSPPSPKTTAQVLKTPAQQVFWGFESSESGFWEFHNIYNQDMEWPKLCTTWWSHYLPCRGKTAEGSAANPKCTQGKPFYHIPPRAQ